MTSGKVQIPEYTAIKFFGDFPGKFSKFLCIFFIRTTGGKLPEDGVFSHGSDRRNANKTATFKFHPVQRVRRGKSIPTTDLTVWEVFPAPTPALGHR